MGFLINGIRFPAGLRNSFPKHEDRFWNPPCRSISRQIWSSPSWRLVESNGSFPYSRLIKFKTAWRLTYTPHTPFVMCVIKSGTVFALKHLSFILKIIQEAYILQEYAIRTLLTATQICNFLPSSLPRLIHHRSLSELSPSQKTVMPTTTPTESFPSSILHFQMVLKINLCPCCYFHLFSTFSVHLLPHTLHIWSSSHEDCSLPKTMPDTTSIE